MESLRKSLPKIARTSLVDEVIGVMRKMLGEDAWPPGSKLPSEQELAKQLGVGRSTVREALRVLGHLGIVEARTGVGTYVAARGIPFGPIDGPQTAERLHQLYEFRRAVEVPAASLAAERRTAEQLGHIQSTWHDCALAVRNDSADEFARLDYTFHLSIVEASHNQFLINAYRTLERAFASHVNVILALGPLRSMLHFHDGLILAIQRRDPEAAARAVRENFVETDVRLQLLSQNGRPTDI